MTATLTNDEIDAAIVAERPFFCPDPAGIKRGDKLSLWTKVGGEQQLVNVLVSREPYSKGKKSIYVDVYGYGVNKSVNVTKLLKEKDV